MRGAAVACLTAALLLAGCTAYPVAPADRMVLAPSTPPAAAARPSAAADRALLVVYRVTYRSAILPAHHAVTLYVGGIEAADIDEGQYTLIPVPPGKTRLESGWSFQQFLDAPGFADLDLQAGRTYYFRVTSGATWLGAAGAVPVAVGLEFSQPTPVGAAVIGAGLVLLAVDEVQARHTGRALEVRSDADATRDIEDCSYVPAEHDFMQAAPGGNQ